MSCERCGREYCDPQSFIADEAECYRLGYERLKAELESVHEAWRQSIDSGNAGWKALSAAEQRAEAAEKRAADMMEVLRLAHPYIAESDPHMTVDGLSRDAVLGRIAALHDEERSAPPLEEKMENKERVRVLEDLLRRAVAGLSTGACYTCGAEPGCNIDCPGCRWVAEAEAALAAGEQTP